MKRLLATALALLVVVITLATGAAPAAAHDETGAFTATQAEPDGSGGYTIDVLLTYTNDGHGAEGATVTVTAQGPTGEPVEVAMAPGDRAGAYTGTFTPEGPGDYTFTATATEPAATTTFSVTVPDTTTTTEARATTTTDEPATTTTAAAEDDEDDSTSVGTIVANTVLLLIGAAAAFFGIRWWRNRRDAA